MPNSMPISLMIAWTFLFGFVNTHQRHAMRFQGASAAYLLALQISTVLGSLAGAGLLIYYFMKVAWYWPFVLFVVSSMIGGLFFGWLDTKLGDLFMSLFSFVGWPASAVWTFLVIHGLYP